MTNIEKCELLKDAIYQLFTNEGRSKSYISKLLDIDRKTLTNYIKECNFPENKEKKYLTPSMEKFIKSNRDFIISKLKQNETISNIAQELNVDRKKLYVVFEKDDKLKEEFLMWKKRNTIKTNNKIQNEKDNSKLNYDFLEIEGEEWRSILGYENYFISNKGRVKKYIKRYDSYCLLKTSINPVSGRESIKLSCGGKDRNLYIARLVGFAFLEENYSEINNTINHKDGNVLNNNVENLEWVSQSQNNTHAYRQLNRSIVDKRRYHFDKILYKKKYEFNTVTAFAKFLGKSETQTRRYMDEPEKHNIEFINYK